MLNRRRFITFIPIATAGMLATRSACAEQLTESDPTAQALGYRDDVHKVDKVKYASYKPGSVCATCVQYSGKSGESNGPCAAFGGKTVSVKGWCMAWAKKG
ncbi:MAG: High potential iron-sulfur protein [Rhodocyclales bacterium]|nr:High potential iron-sulfur protein [Rhodocyclales bacterium]